MTAHIPRLPFALDPLIAEAKRRARQRRALGVLVAVAVVAAGTVLGFELRGLGSVTPVPANLTVLAVGQNGGRALFHLRCDPAACNVAQPAKACAAIAAQPSLVTHPKPYYDMGPNNWYFTITGRLNGKSVHFSGESSWTPQMPLIDKLGLAGPHGQPLRLEPRRHGSIALNQTRTFAPGVLRPGRPRHLPRQPQLPRTPTSHERPNPPGPREHVGGYARCDGGPSTSRRRGHRQLHHPRPPTSR
jgi:hypothetical protein